MKTGHHYSSTIIADRHGPAGLTSLLTPTPVHSKEWHLLLVFLLSVHHNGLGKRQKITYSSRSCAISVARAGIGPFLIRCSVRSQFPDLRRWKRQPSCFSLILIWCISFLPRVFVSVLRTGGMLGLLSSLLLTPTEFLFQVYISHRGRWCFSHIGEGDSVGGSGLLSLRPSAPLFVAPCQNQELAVAPVSPSQ